MLTTKTIIYRMCKIMDKRVIVKSQTLLTVHFSRKKTDTNASYCSPTHRESILQIWCTKYIIML